MYFVSFKLFVESLQGCEQIGDTTLHFKMFILIHVENRLKGRRQKVVKEQMSQKTGEQLKLREEVV